MSGENRLKTPNKEGKIEGDRRLSGISRTSALSLIDSFRGFLENAELLADDDVIAPNPTEVLKYENLKSCHFLMFIFFLVAIKFHFKKSFIVSFIEHRLLAER